MADSDSSTCSSAMLVARRPGESWSYTDTNKIKASHRWTINKFPLMCSAGKRNLKSLRFTGGGPAEWHLELDTKYESIRDSEEYINISLFLDKPANVPMSVDCRVSIVNHERKRCEEKRRRLDSLETKGCVWRRNLIKRDELLRSRAKELIVRDKLTIICDLSILPSSFDAFTVTLPPITPPPNNLGTDLGSLLEGGLCSDVTLVAGGQEFQAHTLILSARSPVFMAMFQHDTKEREEKKVDIPDLSADTVREMLQHIYTGEVSTLGQSAESLLEAADKYDLASLKSACEETLRSKLEVENAARMLILADKHRADQLKADCLHVIAAHPKEVQESEGWSVLESERQDLLLEAGQSLFKRFAD